MSDSSRNPPLPWGNQTVWQQLAHECAQGAIYDSNERYPHSRCLTGTRVVLLQTIKELVDTEDRKIVWISGESGSGKSTVAHTLADKLREEGRLACTFFFSRKHTKRSTFDHVLLTFAYQLGLHHPRAKEIIVKAITDDPALLSPEKSRHDIMESLVVPPLKQLALAWKDRLGMSLILDALEEGATNGNHHIGPFISSLARLLRNNSIPIRNIIITTRPWPQIRSVMRGGDISDVVRLVNFDDYDSFEDVTRFFRHEFEQIYENHSLSFFFPEPWPAEDALLMLAERANGRFIFAATVIRLIDQDQPQDRLPLVCGMLRGDVSRVWGDIDHLYASAINDIDASVRTVGLQYLSLIVNLAEPLSSSNLRFLFGTDIHPYLLPFSAFVSIPPSSSSNVVQIYHTSLRDFLQKCDPQSGHQQLADAETHQRLVTSCFRMMARVLRRDVCGLKDPSLLHDEIPDYTQKRDAIPRALLYTCRHWLYHLQRTGAPPDNATQGLLLDFLEKRVVFAIEVYSIFGELAVGVRLLRAARKFVRTWPTSAIKDTALPLLYDCWRLTLDFFYPISFSALHVYESALPCSPARSKIRSAYMHIIDRPTTLVFEHGLDEEWDCVTRIIETEFSDLLLSPDGAQLVTRAPLEIHVWDTATGQLVTSLSQNIPVPSTTHSFAYNGSHVALCGVRSFYLWNLSTGGCVELFPEPLHLIHGRVRHTSGFMIGASATRDGTPVYHSAQLLATGPLCFSFDGSSIACVAAKPPQAENANTKRCSIYIYDVNTGKLRSQIPFEFEAVRTSLEFAADNNHLLVHNVGFVGIVDVMNGQLLGSLGCCNTQSGWRRTLFSLDNRQIFHLADQGRADIEKYSFGQTTRTVSYQLATQNSATQLHIRGPPPTGSRSLMLQKIEDTSQSEQSLLGANPQPIEYAGTVVGIKLGEQITALFRHNRTQWSLDE